MADMRLVGTGLMAWVDDERRKDASRAQLPEKLTAAELTALLVPKYVREVPAADGWGFEFEYRIAADLSGDSVATIRSPGRDGVFGELPKSEGILMADRAFDKTDFDQDIVWIDGEFVRYPGR